MALDTVMPRRLDLRAVAESELRRTSGPIEPFTGDSGIWYIALLERKHVQRGGADFECLEEPYD